LLADLVIGAILAKSRPSKKGDRRGGDVDGKKGKHAPRKRAQQCCSERQGHEQKVLVDKRFSILLKQNESECYLILTLREKRIKTIEF
jgi:hypothetical protein